MGSAVDRLTRSRALHRATVTVPAGKASTCFPLSTPSGKRAPFAEFRYDGTRRMSLLKTLHSVCEEICRVTPRDPEADGPGRLAAAFENRRQIFLDTRLRDLLEAGMQPPRVHKEVGFEPSPETAVVTAVPVQVGCRSRPSSSGGCEALLRRLLVQRPVQRIIQVSSFGPSIFHLRKKRPERS